MASVLKKILLMMLLISTLTNDDLKDYSEFTLKEIQSFNNAPVIGVMTLPSHVGSIDENRQFHPFDSETMKADDHFYYNLLSSYKR